MNHRAYIGLGSNLEHPEHQVETGLSLLSQLPDTRLAERSSLWRSAPQGYADQPDFVNAVARLDTRLPPHELLKSLQAIEQRQGRQRLFTNGPRTLDLDLLLYDSLESATEALTLPHPRLGSRAFVLLPLRELAGNLWIPGQGFTEELLSKCLDQQVFIIKNEPK